MKCIFLDTNILIDFLADRKPFSNEAARLFNYSLKGKITLYISAVSCNNVYYILRQSHGHNDTIKMLGKISEWTEIISVSKDTIKNAIASDFKDFEDAIQFYSAKTINKIDMIVTRDTKDFKRSTIPVLSSNEAVALLATKFNLNT